jgi:membrane protease YdiL (CAAX protease family)
MTIKRVILIFITILAVFRVFLSLIESINQPQIQSRLELYQTNLVLQAAEFDPSQLDNNLDVNTLRQALLSNDPYLTAQNQYEQARNEIQNSQKKLEQELKNISTVALKNDETETLELDNSNNFLKETQLENSLTEANKLINDLNVKIGILKAVRGQQEEAQKIWANIDNSSAQIAKTLTQLWNNYPQLNSDTEVIIREKLDGWFRYQTLAKLYELTNQDVTNLQDKQQKIAYQAVTKLLIIGIIPLFGGVTGVSLLIFLLAQLLLKKQTSLLAQNNSLTWETPWDGEVIWQVLIIGFFFIGQFLLPLIFGISGFNPTGLSLRYKAFYVLLSYCLMAAGGVIVLYFSIKQFLPLTKDWFKFNISLTDFFWGFGGYLVALPLVVLVSLINQQLWQGQGGSNPILSLALQSQDKVALVIFFLTASVAAPIFEELIFRGFLLPSLTRYLSVWGSILISSLIFAIAHLSISEVLPLTTLGIILGFIYTRSRNLFSPMILHSFWNSGTLLSLFILGS